MHLPLARQNRAAPAVVLIAALCLSVLSFQYYIHNKLYYINSDSLYYYGVAENLLHTGQAHYSSTEVPQKAGSPQIGIVLIMSLFMALGLTKKALFISVALINFIALLTCVFPLYKVSRMTGCRRPAQCAAICAAVFVSRDYFYSTIYVLNDGMFNVVSVWLIYAVARLMRGGDGRDEILRRRTPLLLSISIVLVVIDSLFRVQAVLIPASAFLASIVYATTTRRYRNAAVGALLCALSALTLFLVYRFYPCDPFASTTTSVFGSVFLHATDKIIYFGGSYLVFLVAAAFAGKSLWKPEKTEILFVLLVCGVGLVFTFPMIFSAPFGRYLSFIWPLTIMIIVRVPYTRYVGYASIAFLALQSVFGCMRPADYYHRERFFLYLDKNNIARPGPCSTTFSQPDYERLTYYFLETKVRFSFDASRDSLATGKDIYLVGSRDFVEGQMRAIEAAAFARQKHFSRTSIAPGYSDEAGNSLIRIHDISDITIKQKS
jgi:hypothetical protein